MEGVVFDQVSCFFFFEQTNLRIPAYFERHSTTTALMQMTDQWSNDIDRSRMVSGLLLEHSTAFDLEENHEILLIKHYAYGFNFSALDCIKSYLNGRTQKVFYNGSFSESWWSMASLREVA